MSDDLIRRQDAIDAIGAKSDEIFETKKKGANYPHGDFFQGMAYAENIIKNLPSTQPEQQWIPVTERLPKIGEKVLVSTKYTVFTQVFKRIYGTPDRWGWEHNTIKKVSAWMPRPEPWKGENDEQT